jgi:hypothetical protein
MKEIDTPIIDPATIHFSEDKEKQLAEEAKWLLDPPLLREQFIRILEPVARAHKGESLTEIGAMFEDEMNQRFMRLQLSSRVFEFKVENATTLTQASSGIVHMRAAYRTRPVNSTTETIELKIDLAR